MSSRCIPFVLLFVVALAFPAPAPGRPWRAQALPGAPAPGDTLTLAAALARVFAHAPSLGAAAARSAVAAAAAGQAAARPNPTLALEAENLGGSYLGFDYAEFTVLLTQEFELGGRRSARTAAAREASRLAVVDARTDTLDLYLETRRRYADVVHAEARHRIATRNAALVAELVTAADDLVLAGAALQSDRALAAAAHARAQVETSLADSERRRARLALASLWGATSFTGPVAAAIPLPASVPAADSVARWAEASPAVTRARLATGALRADRAVEKSLRVPPLSASVGARRVEFDDAGTFLVGVSMPLPLWDRRAEAVRAADARVRAADLATSRVRADVAGRLAIRLETLALLVGQVRRMDAGVIPDLEAAAEGLRAAYRAGRASYPDLLEVQRALAAVELEQNDTRRAIEEEIVAIEEITGRTIEELIHE
jgi:cobalt-zinc-cadmium efflux system outer membrane protein